MCAEHLAWIGPAPLAALPRHCPPQSLAAPSQLSAYALELVRRSFDERSCSALEQDLVHFFAAANARMAQLLRDRERRPELVRLPAATSLQVAREFDERRNTRLGAGEGGGTAV